MTHPKRFASLILGALLALAPAAALAQQPPPPPPRGSPPPPPGRPGERVPPPPPGRPGAPPPPNERFAPPPPPPPGPERPWGRPPPPDVGPPGPVPGFLAPPPPGRPESPGEVRAREERERQLRLQDEARERSREARIRKEHEDMVARYQATVMTAALTEEWERYSYRKATIARIRELAVAQARADATRRCDEIMALEEARHAAWLAAHPRG